MHVYHQSTCTLLKNNFSSHTRTWLETVTPGHTRSDIIAHSRTWSNIIRQIFCSKTAVHGRTRLYMGAHTTAHGRTQLHKIYSYRTRSHMVAQTTVHGRTRSHKRPHTVAHGRTRLHRRPYTVTHGRTKNPQLPEWPTLTKKYVFSQFTWKGCPFVQSPKVGTL